MQPDLVGDEFPTCLHSTALDLFFFLFFFGGGRKLDLILITQIRKMTGREKNKEKRVN